MNCSIIAFVAPLFLLSCQTGGWQNNNTSGKSPQRSAIKVQQITHWSTGGKWWAEASSNSFIRTEKAPNSSLPSGIFTRITKIKRNPDSTVTVTFRHAGTMLNPSAKSQGPCIELTAPGRLESYITVNQLVYLGLNRTGEIIELVADANLIKWKPFGPNHQVILEPAVGESSRQGSGKTFLLSLTDRQFFETYSKNDKNSFTKAFNANRLKYKDFTNYADIDYELFVSEGFVYHIGERGMFDCYSESGRGGGGFESDEEPILILSTPASEDFD